MPLPAAFTLICPANDLASLRILDLAQHLRTNSGEFSNNSRDVFNDIDIFVGPHSWRQCLDDCILREWDKSDDFGEAFPSAHLATQLRHDFLVVVELPSPWLLKQLKKQKPELTLIEINDGSQVNGFGNTRSHQQSSLALFAELINYSLNASDHAISVNSSHYLPGLSSLGISWEEAKQIRNTELMIRGIGGLNTNTSDSNSFISDNTLGLFKQANEKYDYNEIVDAWFCPHCGSSKSATTLRKFEDITFLNAPIGHAPVLMEVYHRAVNEHHYTRAAREHRAVNLGNTLIFYFEDSKYESRESGSLNLEQVVGIEFSGEAKYRDLLERLCSNAAFRRVFTTQTGGSQHGAYCIAKRRGTSSSIREFEVDPYRDRTAPKEVLLQFVDALLTELMTFSRPLRDYQGTFFLPLDFSDSYDQSEKNNKGILDGLEELSWQELLHKRYSMDEAKEAFRKQEYGKDHDPCTAEIKDPTFGAKSFKTQVYAQEYFYFEPQIRDFLYPFHGESNGTTAHIRTWQYQPKNCSHVCHEHFLGRLSLCPERRSKKQRPKLEAFISDVKLHYFAEHLFLLEINTKPVFTYFDNNTAPQPSEHYFPNWHTGCNFKHQGSEQKSPLRNVEEKSDAFVPRFQLSSDNDGSDWWLDIVFGDEKTLQFYQQMQIGHWLEFSKSFRLLFTAYTAHAKERNLPEITFLPAEQSPKNISNKKIWDTTVKATSPETNDKSSKDKTSPDASQIFIPTKEDSVKLLSPLIEYWLQKIVGNQTNKTEILRDAIKNVHDDRLFSQLTYGLAGRAPTSFSSNTRDPLFTLALFVDKESDCFENMGGFAYDPTFLENTIEQYCYRRWQKNDVLSGFTDFSNVYMGYGWFYCDVIAKEHIPHHYRRMLILALFYRASMRFYSRAIDNTSRALTDNNSSGNPITELRKKYIHFTTKYWFENITAQIQGQEIFSLIKSNLNLQQEYDFIKEQMNWADGYLKDKHNNRMQFFANITALAAAIFAAVTIGLDLLNFFLPTNAVNLYEKKHYGIKVVSGIALAFCLLGFSRTYWRKLDSSDFNIIKKSLLAVLFSTSFFLLFFSKEIFCFFS